MGSGKSTIAIALSKMIGIPYQDLDVYIENKEQSSIKEIFEQKGEVYFRKIEHLYFKELIELDDKLIIGLGGGTPCYANNHELLIGNNRTSIYLKASIPTLFERLKFNKSSRPIIANKDDEELHTFIATSLFERSYYYNQAQHKVIVDNKSISEVANEIKNLLT